MKVDLTNFPLTETLFFSEKYTHDKKTLNVSNVKANPNNKKVCFVSLNDEDLKGLRSYFDNTSIKDKYISHNRFAVYKFQLSQ